MAQVGIMNCQCGHSASKPEMKAKSRWVITCIREGCPALTQAGTKHRAIEAWNEIHSRQLN